MFRIWIERKDQEGKFIAIEKDGKRLPTAKEVFIPGPSRVVYDSETNLWPQGWVEVDGQIIADGVEC